MGSLVSKLLQPSSPGALSCEAQRGFGQPIRSTLLQLVALDCAAFERVVVTDTPVRGSASLSDRAPSVSVGLGTNGRSTAWPSYGTRFQPTCRKPFDG